MAAGVESSHNMRHDIGEEYQRPPLKRSFPSQDYIESDSQDSQATPEMIHEELEPICFQMQEEAEEMTHMTSTTDTTSNHSAEALVSSTDWEEHRLNAPLVEMATDQEMKEEEMDDEASRMPFGGLSNLGNTCYMASALQMLASLDEFVELVTNEDTRHLSEEKTKLRKAFVEVMGRLNLGETVRPEALKAAIDERVPFFVGYRQQDSHEFLTTLLDLLDEDYKTDNEEQKKNITKNVTNDDRKLTISGEEAMVLDGDNSQEENQEDVSATAMTVSSVQSPQDIAGADNMPFSMLDVDGIDSLLHGANSSKGMLVLPNSSAIEPRYKLIGGRMNTTDVVLTPWSEFKESEEHAGSMAEVSEEGPPIDCSATSQIEAEPHRYCTPVDTTFTTSVRVRLTCDSCRYSRSQKEKYLHLSLEIGSTNPSVDDSLRRFFAPEQREIKCEKCFCETATQTTEITELPRVLLLHLKRFIVDVSPDYSSVTYRKDQSEVAFDEKLVVDEDFGALSEFLAPDCRAKKACTSFLPTTYSIRGVVNHIGSRASCGHYTADAYRLNTDGTRQWIRFNDSFVSKVSQVEAIGNARPTAYMVMYEAE